MAFNSRSTRALAKLSPMTSVVLDVTRAKNPYSGLGQYAIHLGNAILGAAPETVEPRLYLHKNDEDHFSGQSRNILSPKFWHKEDFRVGTSRLPFLNRAQHSPDLWHTFDQLSSYGPVDPKVPVILTVHDLNFPDRSGKSKARGLRIVQKRIDRAEVIVTSSEFAASQISDMLDLRGKPLRVIPAGHCLDETIQAQRPPSLPQVPFIFSIGEFRSTKNFHLLVQLVEQLTDYHLVIAGNTQTTYGERVLKLADESSARARVHLLGKVVDAERRWLYENCAAFLFPSVAEGFGLPVLESMSCGRPVFTTREMSLPEVAGQLGFYWDSLEPISMVETFREGMNQFLSDSDYSDRLQSYASQFKWSKTAQAFVELYHEILQ